MEAALPAELMHTVDREMVCYRQLLVLARTRHCLLRQRHWSSAARVADREAQVIGQLRELETRLSHLIAQRRLDPEVAHYLRVTHGRRAMLVRRLRPIVRANHALEMRHLLHGRLLIGRPWEGWDARVQRLMASQDGA